MAIENILKNINRLVERPETQVAHISDLVFSFEEFEPDAVILSGTLCDFDYYNPEILASFGRFVRGTTTPLLGISGGHQLIGLSFGARVITLDRLEQHEQRKNRPQEYQYRFVRITEPSDPIFQNIAPIDQEIPVYESRGAHLLHVWQNHGLQLDRVPEGFRLLATSYLCRNQMMVKRSESQLIYSVQFHLEKSFEDWNKNRTRWEHPNESRDGRIVFENFLLEAIKHDKLAKEAKPRRQPWKIELSSLRESLIPKEAVTGAEVAEAYGVIKIKDDESGPFFTNSAFVLQVGIQDEDIERLGIISHSDHRKVSRTEFDVVVFAQDIKVQPNWVLPYVFRRNEEIQFVEFELTPTAPGRKVISVEFLYQCHWLAALKLEIDVAEAQGLDEVA